MPLSNLRDLLVHELKDVYNAEKQITKAMPKLIKAANSPELQNALKEHLEITQRQVERLEEVFETLGVSPGRQKCAGMEGLIEEGQELLGMDAEEAVLDAAIIAAAQKIEHYEISAYGTVRTMAELLEEDDVANLLEQTLEEEKEADALLTEIASSINVQAEDEEEEEEPEEEQQPRQRRSGKAAKGR